jgi:ElaB/YqjD/DUF883 family membrane-anchored ribosome-binding protein
MSDPSFPNTGQATPHHAGTETRQPTADLRQAGADLRATAEQARQAASEAASTLKQEAAQAAGTLKQEGVALIDTAKSRAQELAEQGQQAGAQQTQGIAQAVHRAAEALEEQSPELARTVHDAAGAIDNLARALQDRSPTELLRSAEDFARRQPLAFVGVTALAGFALARFAKASAPTMSASHHVGTGPYTTAGAQPMMEAETMSTGQDIGGVQTGSTTTGSTSVGSTTTGSSYPHGPSTPHDTSTGAPGWVADESGTPRPATLASASLGGAVSYRPRGGSENG